MRLFVLNFAIEPLFNSQDKTKLSRWEDRGYNETEVIKAISSAFLKLMKENQPYFDLLCERIIEYKKATSKLSNIELLKSHIVMGDDSDSKRTKAGQMRKVFGCTTRDYDKAELYIVEGLSAGGNLIARRNTKYQAILPIRGKLKNTSGMEDTDLVSNAEVLAIINTIGVGAGAIVDVSKARYGKVIIAVDADSDGAHIQNLVAGLFYMHLPELIKAGKLYVLETPYYEWHHDKKVEFFYYDEKDKIDFNKGRVFKLKGLGSSDPDVAEKYMLDANHRRIVQIVYDPERELEIREASRLLYSSDARRELMYERGVFLAGNIK